MNNTGQFGGIAGADMSVLDAWDITQGSSDIKIFNTNLNVSPNPFSENAQINFTINKTPKVKIYIVDLMGRTVKTIVDSNNNPSGNYKINFSLSDYNQGIYYVVLQTENEKITNKIVYIRQ